MKTKAAQTFPSSFNRRARRCLPLVTAFALFAAALLAQAAPSGSGSVPIEILTVEGEGWVEVLRAGSRSWDRAYPGQVLKVGDRLKARPPGRALLRWSDQSKVRIDARAELEILPPPRPKAQAGFNLLSGILYFFHRDKPADLEFKSRTVTSAIRGTEFNVHVEEDGRTILTMLDGEVEMTTPAGQLILKSGEQGVAEAGQPPRKTAVVSTINVIQWCLYYPGVLDLDELPLAAPERQVLQDSFAAYREGDLLRALGKYPPGRQPTAGAEQVYLAALLLAVGEVEQAEKLFAAVGPAGGPADAAARAQALAGALRQLIAAVKLQSWQSERGPQPGTECLAESYYQQSRAKLEAALDAARQAVNQSAGFAFGWARVAELEFSFGRTDRALEALDKSLALAPRNAEALALRGFLLSAQNKIAEAITHFERAIEIDGALGNAWLGRGLCRIRQGKSAAGRDDLLAAATLEPQRALLRSYLGKAYSNEGDNARATSEIQLAKRLDGADPTAWLYSALLLQQQNRINEAVRELEHSQELNENRRVYRSQLLIDQDRAVRGANLANIYRDAGMTDVSVREAARAVSADYGNYSAHLFLADSFNQFRDPNLINLRYETPAESEYLLANLLSPVGAGTLSPAISQQEYSKLFERDRLGLLSGTEYLSRGAWTQQGVQFGTFANSSYALEAFYRTDRGQRPNNDVEQRQLSVQLKQQLTPQDTVYVQAIHYDAAGGDLFQYYDPYVASYDFRFKEKQEPLLVLGYHHEWYPGMHTLFLAGRLVDRFSLTNTYGPTLVFGGPEGRLTFAHGISMNQEFLSDLEIYTTELQQIWQYRDHHTIVGVRLQSGDFRSRNFQAGPDRIVNAFPDAPEPAALQDFTTDFRRTSAYAYHSWQIVGPLRLLGGVTYDRLRFPENFRSAPLSDAEETLERVLPKAGLIWTVGPRTALRFAYTRALSGASLDQSYRLEPSQVAGFIQSYRSLAPESVVGPNAGARFETFGVSVEHTLPTGTYLGASGEILHSEVRRTVGAFHYDPALFQPADPAGVREHLDFQERSLVVTVNQLLGDEWSAGLRYRLTQAELQDDFVGLRNVLFYSQFAPRQQLESVLHNLNGYLVYNHRCGFFAKAEGLWYAQSNHGYEFDIPGDDFWQANLLVGYRFPRRQAELSLALLNLNGADYQLNPLTPYNELPRDRTLAVRLLVNF